MAPLQGYKSNGQAIGGVSSSTANLQAMSSTGSKLLQKFEAVADGMYAQKAKRTQLEASNDALVDSAKYRRDIDDARTKFSNEPSKLEQKLNEIKGQRFFDASTIYGAAYQDKFTSAYANEITQDVLEKSSLSEIASEGDAKAYAKAMQAYGTQMTRSAPNQALANFARLSYEKAGVTGFKRLTMSSQRDTFSRDKKKSEGTIEALSEVYTQLKQQGDPTEKETVDILAQTNTAIDAAVRDGFMSPEMGVTTKLHVIKQGEEQLIKADFNRAVKNGEEHVYLRNLQDSKNLNKIFTPDEISKIYSDLKGTMTINNNLKNAEDEEFEVIHKHNSERAVLKLQKAQVYGELTKDKIDSAYKMGYITKGESESWYSSFYEGGSKVKDMDKELQFRASILAYSDKDILSDDTLNNSQKISLLDLKDKTANSSSGKWTSSVEGKNAIERIKNNWKSLTISSPFDYGGAGVKGAIEDFNKTYNEFMNQMLKLPADQRVSRAIPFADAAISAYREKEFERKTKRKESRDTVTLKKKEALIEQNAQSYRDSLTDKNRGYYDKGVAIFRTSFGNTGVINFGGSNKDVEWK